MNDNQGCPVTPFGTPERNSRAPTGVEEHPHVAEPKSTDKSVCATGPKARRSERISKEIPILLFGSEADGRVFTEETHTVVLSRYGAGIVSRYRLIPEQELVLRWTEAGREAEVRVVGQVAEQDGLHTYGVAFVNEHVNFWQMEFAPGSGQQERPLVLLLECGGCHKLVELLNGDFEYDICAIHGGLTRFCAECGMLTVWRVPQEAVPSVRRAKTVEVRPAPELPQIVETQRDTESREAAVVEPYGGGRIEIVPLEESFGMAESANELLVDAPLLATAEAETQEPVMPASKNVSVAKSDAAAPPADASVPAERRVRTRAKVNFFACVRSEGYGEEIVRCIDMGKGGVSFRTPNCYEVDTKIEIAVPFSPEERSAPSIFVKGRIANVRVLESGKYRCGVEFLR
jgi:PilZ domain